MMILKQVNIMILNGKQVLSAVSMVQDVLICRNREESNML